jgi:4-amino-4-deoxy-L-arabinose transferase-like glycosyltransferase
MFDKKVAIIIFILAFATRLVFILLIPHHPLVSDDKDYDRLGFSLSQGEGYVNSLGEPTAFRPPIYPLFLGIIYYIAGHDLFWVRFMQAILGAGICLLIYLIATIIFDRTIANISGFLCCFYPPLIVWTSEIMSETLFTFLLLLGIWKIISRNNYRSLLISGIIFGFALLTRGNLIFFFPFLFYWIFLSRKRNFLKATAILMSGVLLILLPWTFRNYNRLHSFVPLANISGITFYNSYVAPDRGFGFTSLKGVNDEYYRLKSETEQSNYLMRKAIEYIKKSPKKVVKLTALKLLHFIYPFDGYWYSLSFGSKYNIFWGMVFCFSLVGIVHHIKDKDIHKKLIYFLLVSFFICTIVFYGSPRFRLPLEPLLICFAASGMIRLYKNNRCVFSLLTFMNMMLFVIFRFFSLQVLFDYLKKWI